VLSLLPRQSVSPHRSDCDAPCCLRSTTESSSGPPVKFELLTGDEDVSASRVSLNGNTGNFEIQDAVAGSYTLRATQSTEVAEVPVKVAGSDVNGLQVALAPAVDLRVTTKFVGTPSVEVAEAAARNGLGMCSVSLHPLTRRSAASYFSNGQRDAQHRPAGRSGELTIAGVLPGTYRVSANCANGYPSSGLFGSQDVLASESGDRHSTLCTASSD
jgi:hypothetical protein